MNEELWQEILSSREQLDKMESILGFSINDDINNYTQALNGKGISFSRETLKDELHKYFKYVCVPYYLPNDPKEFDLTWPITRSGFHRQIFFVTNDKKYKVKAIAGLIDYPNNINECYKKSENIYSEIKATLPDLKDMGTVSYTHLTLPTKA